MIIYKYPLELKDGAQEMLLPPGSTVRSIQMQGGRLTVWAEHAEGTLAYTKYPHLLDAHYFSVIATGRSFTYEDDERYFTTVQDGPYVWHVFYRVVAADQREADAKWRVARGQIK